MLLPALEGRRVDMLFQDTPHTEENQRFEFTAALTHAARRLLLLDASGGTAPTLRAMCAEHDGTYHEVPMRSRGHIYPGGAITFGVFDKANDRHQPRSQTHARDPLVCAGGQLLAAHARRSRARPARDARPRAGRGAA